MVAADVTQALAAGVVAGLNPPHAPVGWHAGEAIAEVFDLDQMSTFDTVAVRDGLPHAAAAIKEIYATKHINADGSTTCRLRIKMRDKLGALELLGKHLGMFAKKDKQRGERSDHELRQRIERRVKAMTPEQREKITETLRQAYPEEDRPPYIYPVTLP